MTPVFIDTSAILALLNRTDRVHETAKRIFEGLAARRAVLLTTSYILVETYALLGRRFGPKAAREFREKFVPLLDVTWVDEDLHERALDEWLRRDSRQLSLVDVVSFLVMRRKGISEAFGFDRHFDAEGFSLLS
ncbi:MAG: PIN domain-containing protein [Deltaproteobacteria bacterium]|nr:PIN domain-containing protein [Deltaproteobacteria bacterium]